MVARITVGGAVAESKPSGFGSAALDSGRKYCSNTMCNRLATMSAAHGTLPRPKRLNPPWEPSRSGPTAPPPPWQQPKPPPALPLTSQPTPLFPPLHDEFPPPPPTIQQARHYNLDLPGGKLREEQGAPYDLDKGSLVEQRPRPGNEKDVVDEHRDEMPAPARFEGKGQESSGQDVTTSTTQSGIPHSDAPASLDQSENLLPGEKQTFDYHHQSCPPVVRDREVEVFDYNHRPPHPRWNVPPPPPHPMGPLGPPPFPPEPHWGLPPPPPDLPPPIPYFDLPAGIMAPLVPLHEHGYRTLNPMDVRLPPPQPPTDRLLQAVEEFYAPETEDKPRTAEGWEARALLGFFEAKVNAREAMKSRYRGTRRPAPPRDRPRRRSRSYSRSRSRSQSRSPRRRTRRSRSKSYSPSRSRSYSRSRSRSPWQRRRRSSRSPSSRSYSSSRSRSGSPRSPHRRRRSRSRSRSRSPFIPTVESRRKLPKRPASPEKPSFGGELGSGDRKLGEANVGHQLLRKMGWEEGVGLGVLEQGIHEPIRAGEVRDKQDKYKGVGMESGKSDPFELFRKNKSYTFNRRGPPGAL